MKKTNKKKMKKFTDSAYIERFLVTNDIPRNIKNVHINEAKHIPLLSSESYVVKYDCDMIFKGSDIETNVMLRGNRINKFAAKIWMHVNQNSKNSHMNIVPTPFHYFEKDNFMLYLEYSGDTLRDYAHDYRTLYKISPEIGKKLAWWHQLPFKETFGTRTEKIEKIYWNSVEKKIKKHLPKKNYTNKMRSQLEDIYRRQQTYNAKAKPVLTHNDFQASNILYDTLRDRIGIIDFGATTGFTPVNDVATYMVHLAVMTNKYLTVEKTIQLQKRFLKNYLNSVPKKLKERTIHELPIFQARAAADIIATTAVALSHTNNPYRKIIPKMLIPVLTKKLLQDNSKTRPIRDLMVQLQAYHE